MPRRGAPRDPAIDSTDRRILDCVIENPATTVEGIVKYLDEQGVRLSESAVGKRVAELLNNGILERIIIIRDWVTVGYPFRYRIDVKADMKELRLGRGGPAKEPHAVDSQKKLGAYIKDVLSRKYVGRLVVLEVTILLGQQADLSITVRARDSRTVLNFVTEDLRALGGIEATMTSHEAWTYGEPEQT
jgi:DNA-binding Lrp family transcriptional regulator